MPRAFNAKLPWRPIRHLLTIAVLQLLTAGSSWSLFPVMAPPLNVVINGERKTLVVCVVNALSEEALSAVWFSNGNGSMLESFTYTVSGQEDDGFSTISQLAIHTKEFESWDAVICYVAQNKTSRAWNTTSLQISEGSIEDSCLDENQGTEDQISSTATPHLFSQILLLLAIRILLFKFLLTDVLITCCILYKREDPSPVLKSHICPAVYPPRFDYTPVYVYHGWHRKQWIAGER
ncbi:pre T-cell antigen receptor alpha [Eublepharis macularius]|uniref:pre T-cell antigen receptor alpha n=1 Tax=Eublepharis macularius TaxID=481883 RepID=UPI0024109E3D|nr:pre T-cell antigen receptor alpha [Eublepharis macularius]